ncbi:MAG: ArsR family transcriptional regulator [Chloroflexi bacterium]|nr:ArsR family transcriptional regulator [Chloroflexota bacterium]
MIPEEQLIEVFKALSDPNRLHLFKLLLISDRTNSELIGETGLKQNLLSHHLSALAECGLIHAQQSIGDARRRYYCPNLDIVSAVSRWWRLHSPSDQRPLPSLPKPLTVLFLCLRNGERSLIAEAVTRHMAPNALIPYSAGVQVANDISPLVGEVLREHKLPTDSLSTQTYHALTEIPFDYVVTVCDRVHEHPLPIEFADAQYLHWSLRDPHEEANTPAGQLIIARELFTEIEQRLAFFVNYMAHTSEGP